MALVRKLCEDQSRAELREKVSGFHIHTKASFRLLFSLSANKQWRLGHVPSIDINTAFSLWNNVIEQKPDLMQIQAYELKPWPGEDSLTQCSPALMQTENTKATQRHSSDFIDSPL